MPFRMRRFEESLSMHTNPTAKENLMAGSETYDTLKTLPQKARWLRGLMARLEDQVGKAVAAEIMEACGRRCIRLQRSWKEPADSSRMLTVSTICWTG